MDKYSAVYCYPADTKFNRGNYNFVEPAICFASFAASSR